VDSVGKPHLETNLYTYTGNNPTNRTDPSGLDPVDPQTGKDNPVLKCHVVTHNDPTENLHGALIIGGVVTGLTLGPEVPAIGRSLYYWLIVTYLKDPTTYNNFAVGFLTPGPSPTAVGNIGSATKMGFDWAYYNWKTYYNVPVRNNPAECDPCH
jgi:hypothetical protein